MAWPIQWEKRWQDNHDNIAITIGTVGKCICFAIKMWVTHCYFTNRLGNKTAEPGKKNKIKEIYDIHDPSILPLPAVILT
jgi:hypothetical protein